MGEAFREVGGPLDPSRPFSQGERDAWRREALAGVEEVRALKGQISIVRPVENRPSRSESEDDSPGAQMERYRAKYERAVPPALNEGADDV